MYLPEHCVFFLLWFCAVLFHRKRSMAVEYLFKYSRWFFAFDCTRFFVIYIYINWKLSLIQLFNNKHKTKNKRVSELIETNQKKWEVRDGELVCEREWECIVSSAQQIGKTHHVFAQYTNYPPRTCITMMTCKNEWYIAVVITTTSISLSPSLSHAYSHRDHWVGTWYLTWFGWFFGGAHLFMWFHWII